jgi:hypothetical protein
VPNSADLLRVLAHHVDDRLGRQGVGVLHPLERRRLEQPQPDEQADRDQDDAEQERDAPAPGQELLVGGEQLHECEDRGRQEQSRRHAHLRPASEEAAATRRRVLDRHEHCPAPLSAHADALRQAQDHQD